MKATAGTWGRQVGGSKRPSIEAKLAGTLGNNLLHRTCAFFLVSSSIITSSCAWGGSYEPHPHGRESEPQQHGRGSQPQLQCREQQRHADACVHCTRRGDTDVLLARQLHPLHQIGSTCTRALTSKLLVFSISVRAASASSSACVSGRYWLLRAGARLGLYCVRVMRCGGSSRSKCSTWPMMSSRWGQRMSSRWAAHWGRRRGRAAGGGGAALFKGARCLQPRDRLCWDPPAPPAGAPRRPRPPQVYLQPQHFRC